MTREEAIEKLELLRQKVDEETYRALILAIKTLEQEPCEDAISRKAVIRLIRNKNSALKDIFITHSAGEELSRQINELPSVTQKPNFCASCKHNTDNEICLECEYDGITRGMTRYESVTQKSGKWIDYSDEGFVECPFCGHATNCEDNIDELHYCFFCGAKMESEE